jgi:hypothetical protein
MPMGIGGWDAGASDRLARRKEMELRYNGPLPEDARRYIEHGGDRLSPRLKALRADMRFARTQARSTVDAVRSWRAVLATGCDGYGPGAAERIAEDQGARLRYLTELRSQHSALVHMMRRALEPEARREAAE